MKTLLRLSALLLGLILSVQGALADMPELRGYDYSRKHNEKYIYVTFGNYFSDGYGGFGPVLWRVLGKGVPAAEDVSTYYADNDNVGKAANEDVITPENEDVWCLMTEYIVDFHRYNQVRDTRDGKALEYKDSEMFRFLNDFSLERDENGKPVGLPGWMFTENEIESLVYMPDRGYVSLPSRRGELFRFDYGFINEDFREWLPRQATGTKYAFDQGLKYIVDCWSWYWTTDRRRVGFRWIVGDNGHTSVAGAEREGGVRLICYPHMDMMECLGGSGTLNDPYRLVTKKDYMLRRMNTLSDSARSAVLSQRQANAFALSTSQADAVAREKEAARIAAELAAAEQARVEELVRKGKSNLLIARRSTYRSIVHATRQLNQVSDSLQSLNLMTQDTAPSASGVSFEAAPSGMVFLPAK